MEDEQRATEDDMEHEDEVDGDDDCQEGILGHMGSQSLNLSTQISVDNTAILHLKGCSIPKFIQFNVSIFAQN